MAKKKIAFVLALHSHQPVGNFDHVFEENCARAYLPFLKVLAEHPRIPFSMHYSGSLLEWIEERVPEIFDRLKALVERGQVELIGGGFYEPILTMLPERDRAGQIAMMRDYIRRVFKAEPRGFWLAERVWEQSLTKSLADAAVEFVAVDDYHFKCAGLSGPRLRHLYQTEDEGRRLKIFPISEELRYYIPFKDPERTTELLAEAAAGGGTMLCYADDGEKFGTWPQTHKHVYTDGWLERFLRHIESNLDWIEPMTMGRAAETLPAAGRAYLPDCSYREMTEWALPADVLVAHEDLSEKLKDLGLYESAKFFLRGGSWRNFKMKYPEASRLYGRMIEASNSVAKMQAGAKKSRAQRELYRGQCNCAYWHGVFGGLYLPHLRTAVDRHVIAADNIASPMRSGQVRCLEGDFDLDGREEIKISSRSMNVYVKPDRGGHVYEIDLREKHFNLTDTLSRRPEAYHRKVAGAMAPGQAADGTSSIHDALKAKVGGLERALVYDPYLRESLIDHFFDPAEGLEKAVSCAMGERGSFVDAPYEYEFARKGVALSADGTVTESGRAFPVRIEKSITLDPGECAAEFRYRLAGDRGIGSCFSAEFGVNLLAGDAPDRYYRAPDGEKLGKLSSTLRLDRCLGVALVDEWLDVAVIFEFDPPAELWLLPIQTVSQSEAGLELVYQGSIILPRWHKPLQIKNVSVREKILPAKVKARSK